MSPLHAPEDRPAERRPLREVAFLAKEIASQSSVPVLPSTQWGWHFPQGGAQRQERLQGLVSGKYEPEDVYEALQPDALLYDVRDIEQYGLESVAARLRDQALMARDYDYRRFAQFAASFQGKNVDLQTIQTLYDGVAGNRIRQSSIQRSLGGGGAPIIERLRGESSRIAQNFDQSRGLQRVLQALQLDWSQSAGYSQPAEAQQVRDQLSAKEQHLFDGLSEIYRDFVHTGGEHEYEQLVSAFSSMLPAVEQVQNQMSPEMEKLQEELEEFQEQIPQPGDPGGPTFPPDANDLHNQMHELEQGESVEGIPAQPFYEIEPAGTSMHALTGHYVTQRKSRFVPEALTWSNDTQLSDQEYTQAIAGTERQRISGTINTGLKNIGVPNTYALDASSLQVTSGPAPRFYRDQNGCFYVFAESECSFSVDFLKDEKPFVSPPTQEDLTPLPGGKLTAATEQMLGTFSGGAREKAQRILKHLLERHFYPGGGDHQAANALKLKIKSGSTPETYLSNIDASEYQDCDLADTLGAHLLRRAGIPARLAIGHMVQSVKGGKAQMNGSTGHAWVEFWDETEWIPIDFTPHAKPEDKKKKEDEEGEKGEPGQEADDGMMERPPEENGDLADQMREKVEQQMQSMQQQGEVSDADMQQAQQDLKQAQEDLQRMEKRQKELQQQVQDADSFRSLEELEQQLQKEDLLDDMTQDLQERIENREEQKKDELKDELNKMEKEGFLDEKRKEELEKQLQQEDPRLLDQLQKQLQQESAMYNEYDEIRREVMPMVESWYKFFVQRLPKEPEMEDDEETLGRSGRLDRRAIQRPRNLLLMKTKHPRQFKDSPRPRFIGSILVDISGSMKTGGKDKLALRLLVFYAELFSRIEQEFGYLRFSINVFSDSVSEVKTFDQDYQSFQRYEYEDDDVKETATVRARLMKAVQADGGTNMLEALKRMSEGLNEQKRMYPHHASALYCVGDGGDTCGNQENIQKFLQGSEEQGFFGEHMRSAIMLGNEQQRKALAAIFGDEHTAVADTFEEVVFKSMQQYDRDIMGYCKQMGMTAT